MNLPRRRSELDAAELRFLAALDESFLAAETQASTTRRLCLAGRLGIRLRIAGAGLASSLLPALRWLVDADRAELPRFEIRAFAGGRLPANPWRLDERSRGEISGGAGARIATVLVTEPPALSVVDRDRGIGWYWTASPDRLPAWELAAPFVRLLPLLLAEESVVLTHGGAVGDGRRALLLAGPGGTGKSTTSLAALSVGLEVLGDDYVLVDEAGGPRVSQVFASAKADGASLAKLERAGIHLVSRGREANGKSVVELPERARPAGDGHRALAAIVLPRIAEGTGALVPISPARAVRALAPSSIFQLPFAGSAEFARLARVARAVPSFQLEVGPEIPAVGRALARALAEHGSR